MLCPEKQAFATLRGAAEAAVEQLANGRINRAYVCDRCTRYHLTSQPLGGRGEITADMVYRLAVSVGAR